ncbi:hypothetical protein B566_EDAN006598 [Ephemera danica]|nr:hypothetical protein B566_EDAN006598 [Ephemera danica]
MDPDKNEFPIEWLKRKYKDMGIDNVPTDFPMSPTIVTAFNKLKQRNEEADSIMENFLDRSKFLNEVVASEGTMPDLYTDEKPISDNAIAVEMSNVAVDIAQLVLQKSQTVAEAKEVDSIIKNTTENINEYQM